MGFDTSIYSGLEFDWIGIDGAEQVALFSSGGGGFIPDLPSVDVRTHEAAIAALLAKAPSTGARIFPVIPPQCTNTWRLVAERGLYAYDCSPNGGPYELEAVPLVARLARAFPVAVRRTFVRLPSALRFDASSTSIALAALR